MILHNGFMNIRNKNINLSILNNKISDDADWNTVMQYVDAIEKIDISDKSYTWEMFGEKYNNFQKITFDIYTEFVYVGIDLELDPSQKISSINIKDNIGKLTAVKLAINETIDWYKNY